MNPIAAEHVFHKCEGDIVQDEAYREWWKLHLRVASGERLNAEEQARYDAGVKELDESETLRHDLASLRQLRDRVVDLDAKCQQAQARRQKLQKEIAALESMLSTRTRELLGVEVE